MSTLAGILGALAAPSRVAPRVVIRPPRWRVAAAVAHAIEPASGTHRAVASPARALRSMLVEVLVASGLQTTETFEETTRLAWEIVQRTDDPAVILAAVRALLDDAPAAWVEELDRAAVACARAGGLDLDAASARAEGILAEVFA